MKSRKVPMKNAILALLIIISSCVLSNGCKRPQDSRTVRAAYVPAGYYLPFLIVESDGLLEKRGYSMKLQSFGDNAEMISLFINGHLDVTAQSCFTMFPIETQHPGLFKFIYGQYTNSYYFMVPTSSKYLSLGHLKGAKIGTWKSPTAENYIKLILRGANLEVKRDYDIQRFDATDLAPALENGVVPVIWTCPHFMYQS
jgi:ABC-type nitrate/sulfonate/bicarbonate transport system substrate-binding protein